MKKLRMVGVILLVALIGIQFIPINRNLSNEVLPSDFMKTYNPPVKIKTLLNNSCYNCHSNNTIYPWYSYVQPIGWLLERHIRKGKEELNLSEFGYYSSRRKKSKLKSMANQIRDNEMPISSYTLIHHEAVLSENDKQVLIDWINTEIREYK